MNALSTYLSKYTLKDVTIIIVLTLVYFVAGKLGLELAFFNPSATPIWAPTGIAIAAFLLLGNRVWPAIFVGAFIVNLTTAGNIATSLCIAIGNTLEGLIGAWLIIRFIGKSTVFTNPGNIFKYLGLVGLLATAVSAYIGVTTLLIGGLVSWQDYAAVWFTWWFGDMGGALIVAPFLMLWAKDHSFPRKIFPIIEVIVAFTLLILLSRLIFLLFSPELFINTIIVFFFLPILVWIAFRFGPRETSTALLILYVVAALGTIQGTGPLVRETPTQSLLVLQIFIGILFVGKMPLAAAAQQVRESEEKYKKLISISPDAIFVTDLQGKIQVIDQQVLKFYGLKNENEIIGKSSFDFIVPEDIEKTKEALSDLIQKGVVSNLEFISLRNDGTRFYTSANASLILNSRGRPEGRMIVARDVTREKELDKAKSDFYAMAAHKLRAPLSTMHWNIELLLSEKNQDSLSEPIKEKLSEIYSNNKKLVRLVKNLLDFSRIEEGMQQNNPEEVKVVEVIQKIVDEMKTAANARSITLAFQTKGELGNITVDPERFKEIISNLISNAIKFNKENGQVTISVEEKGDNLHIEVADEGFGIPKEEREKIFGKFYRTSTAKKQDPEGTGIGLYMIKSYVEDMNGKIWFESKKKGEIGSIFYVEIPIKKAV